MNRASHKTFGSTKSGLHLCEKSNMVDNIHVWWKFSDCCSQGSGSWVSHMGLGFGSIKSAPPCMKNQSWFKIFLLDEDFSEYYDECRSQESGYWDWVKFKDLFMALKGGLTWCARCSFSPAKKPVWWIGYLDGFFIQFSTLGLPFFPNGPWSLWFLCFSGTVLWVLSKPLQMGFWWNVSCSRWVCGRRNSSVYGELLFQNQHTISLTAWSRSIGCHSWKHHSKGQQTTISTSQQQQS